MTYMEIEHLARKLSPQDRIRLAESLLHSLRVEKRESVSKKTPIGKLTVTKQSSLLGALGVLRMEGKVVPTDDQAKDLAVEYLMGKYS